MMKPLAANTEPNFAHQELPDDWQEEFHKQFRMAQEQSWLFKTLNESETRQYMWGAVVVGFALFTFWANRDYCKLYPIYVTLWFAYVAVLFQLYFIFHHMLAHAMFYNYRKFSPEHCANKPISDPWCTDGNPWKRQTLVYFVAFMHHHRFVKPATIQTITSAHWVSFSGIADIKVASTAAIVCLLRPHFMIPIAAWELYVVLFPAMHGYQHLSSQQIGLLYPVIHSLAQVGIIVGKAAHGRHHDHNHPTGYQGFASSGFNLQCLDPAFDNGWNTCYRTARDTQCILSDVVLRGYQINIAGVTQLDMLYVTNISFMFHWVCLASVFVELRGFFAEVVKL
jgi:hypothetical protein